MFPLHRGRRLRVNESIRSLVRETSLSPADFMFPMFIMEGENTKVEIPSMPGIFRRTLDLTVEEVKELFALGIRAVNIYVKVSDDLKDNTGKEAWNDNGLMQRAIRAIKAACPEMIVMPDVALDPYSIYGHDGIIEKGDVANDATNDALVKMAVSHAAACMTLWTEGSNGWVTTRKTPSGAASAAEHARRAAGRQDAQFSIDFTHICS